MGERKEEGDTFLRKKKRRIRKQCYHNDICRWKKEYFCRCRFFSSEAEITRGIVCIKIYKDTKIENFKKDPMNLIETNNKINQTSDRSVSSNN